MRRARQCDAVSQNIRSVRLNRADLRSIDFRTSAAVDELQAIRLSEEIYADGEAFFRVACDLGLEGIIAKHRARPHRSGKRPQWLKIKCVRRDNFVIVGFEPSTIEKSGKMERVRRFNRTTPTIASV